MARQSPKSGKDRIPQMGEVAEDIAKQHKFSAKPKDDSQTTVFILIGLMLVFIVIGAGVLLLLFSGILAPVPPTQPPPTTTNQTGNETNVTIAGCDDQCNLDLAINTSSPNYCEFINSSAIAQQCYLALSNASLASCIKLDNSSMRYGCVLYHAESANDSTICNNLAEPDKTSCMSRISPCFEKSGVEKDLCLALEQKDVSFCKSDTGCIFNYSKSTKDNEACKSLPTLVMEYACRSNNLNKDECYYLSLISQKDLCYQMYANLSDDPIVCTMISQDTVYSFNCFSYFAVKDEDFSLCNYLSLDYRWECYSNYSFITKDLSGCKNIDPLASTSRFRCFYDYAKSYGDPSACDPINDPSQTITCYVGAIMNNTDLDYSTCSRVVITQWRNKCYMQSAILNNNPSLCNMIQTESERNNCLNQVS